MSPTAALCSLIALAGWEAELKVAQGTRESFRNIKREVWVLLPHHWDISMFGLPRDSPGTHQGTWLPLGIFGAGFCLFGFLHFEL